MLRKLAVVIWLAGAIVALDLQTSAAAPISTRNPYRSFNISGVNYGSMQWERQHRGQSYRSMAPRGGGFFFRRR